MQQDYDFVMGHVFADEGGYGWNHNDPGGPTKYGITCYDLAEHMGQKMTSMTAWAPTVQAMTKATAEEIYQTKYATYDRFNELQPGKDYVILDYGINSGISRPVKVAQAMLKLPQTGKFDNVTLAAINKSDPDWFIQGMCAERISFMKSIKGGASWKIFGDGWGTRVNSVQTISTQLAHGIAGLPAPATKDVPAKKAVHAPATTNIVESTLAGMIAALGGLIPSIEKLTPNGINAEFIIGTLAVVGLMGMGYYIYHLNKINALNNKVTLPASVQPRSA